MSIQQKYLTLYETDLKAALLAKEITRDFEFEPLVIYGLPRGGISTMYLVARHLLNRVRFTEIPENADLIIDDIYDTGKTAKMLSKYDKPMYFLIDKRETPCKEWIVFPWETEWKEKFSANKTEK